MYSAPKFTSPVQANRLVCLVLGAVATLSAQDIVAPLNVGTTNGSSAGNDIVINGTSAIATGMRIYNSNYLANKYWIIGHDSVGGLTFNNNGTDLLWMGRSGTSDLLFNGFQSVFSGKMSVGLGSNPTSVLSVADGGNATLRVGISGNKSNAVAQIIESLVVSARANTVPSQIVAGDVNYYNDGVGTTWAGTCLYYYGTGMTGVVAPGISQTGAACLMGQNSSRLAIGVNGVVPIQFFNGTGELAQIAGNGNFGIGGTPAYKLDVFGQTRLQGNAAVVVPAATDGYISCTVTNTGSVGIGLNNTVTTNSFGAPANSTYVGGSNGFPLVLTTMGAERIRIGTNGNVGIGVTNPTSKLAVAGTICASEVKVTASPADYVFADDYKLRPLSEVEMHVKANRHLPGVPQWR